MNGAIIYINPETYQVFKNDLEKNINKKLIKEEYLHLISKLCGDGLSGAYNYKILLDTYLNCVDSINKLGATRVLKELHAAIHYDVSVNISLLRTSAELADVFIEDDVVVLVLVKLKGDA